MLLNNNILRLYLLLKNILQDDSIKRMSMVCLWITIISTRGMRMACGVGVCIEMIGMICRISRYSSGMRDLCTFHQMLNAIGDPV